MVGMQGLPCRQVASQVARYHPGAVLRGLIAIWYRLVVRRPLVAS